MTIKEAIDTLKQAMADDPDYAYGWHCNIAMAFQDEGADYEQAQRAASRFMRTAFDVEGYEPKVKE